MTAEERVVQEIRNLNEAELQKFTEYLAFLKFRSRSVASAVDESQLATLYAEFGDEDRALAEEGMTDYVTGLASEDA